MPIQLIFFNKELTTRRHAFVWVGIWLALIITTLFSRPLLPYQETRLAAITWEMFNSGHYLLPFINGSYADGAFPLIHWINIVIWKLFGISEISLRLNVSVFSLGTLLLTGWAAYQLWPNERKIRANAPLILIGSLMWTIFATANIEQIYFTFFTVLAVNFLIRVWQFQENRWWIGFAIALILGLFSSGVIFLIYILPIALLAPSWTDRYKSIYLYLAISVVVALCVFSYWAYLVALHYPKMDLLIVLGIKNLLLQLSESLPFYIYFVNLVVILFPWVLWLRLYRLYHEAEKDNQLRFCSLWFITFFICASVTSSALTAFFSVYPALCLIIARIYEQRPSTKKDIVLIVVTMMLAGVLLVVIPMYYAWLELPTWTKKISPLWGCGLILFSVTFFFNARDTRIYTLALMSVALTLALNFGVVRQAADFYDLAPAGERISWYQDRNIAMGHDKRYQGQFHFVGRLKKPLYTLSNEEDRRHFQEIFPNARMIVYVDEMTDLIKQKAEYWQPFRGKYLIIVAMTDAPLVINNR